MSYNRMSRIGMTEKWPDASKGREILKSLRMTKERKENTVWRLLATI